MSREWTERHIRELIDDELRDLKPSGNSDNNGFPYSCNISQMLPYTENGNFDMKTVMFIKKLYFFKENDGTYRAEACVIAPSNYIYSTFPQFYKHPSGGRIVGMMGTSLNNADSPYYPLPVFETINSEGKLIRLTPYDSNGNIDIPYMILRDSNGNITKKFAVGIYNWYLYSVQAAASYNFMSTTVKMGVNCLIPQDITGFSPWSEYITNFKDPLFRIGTTHADVTHTFCFTYREVEITYDQQSSADLNYRIMTKSASNWNS